MAQYIQVGNDVIEFPDDMTSEQITSILSKQGGQTAAPTAAATPAAAPAKKNAKHCRANDWPRFTFLQLVSWSHH